MIKQFHTQKLKSSMEMPGRRSNYSPLNQYPDDVTGAPFYESLSGGGGGGESKKAKPERGFDWESNSNNTDHRLNQQSNRIGNVYSSIGLQRQSSGSSFGESSLSGEYYLPMLSNAAASEIDVFSYVNEDGFRVSGGGDGRGKEVGPTGGGSSYGKSWAQQTEESYQLQLALALRLSSEATCADDPNFLDPVPDESALRSASSSSAEAVSHRFWV